MEQTREERIKELLEQPATEALADIKGPSLGDLVEVPESVTEVETEETERGGKKVRIPASRLKTLTSKIDELESRLQESQSYAERVNALESQLQNQNDDLPDYWKEAYGDTDISRRAYKDQQRVMREEMEREFARREAADTEAEQARAEQIETIEQSFDEQMDSLEEDLGRDLSATQKSELMDIVGEYSPQQDGKYLAYMPIEKAYDIWLKGQGMSQSKQRIADIASLPSGGSTPSAPSNPFNWREKFGLN